MNRRTFNELVGLGVLESVGRTHDARGSRPRRRKFLRATHAGRTRFTARSLVDMHIPDWDPALLSEFDAADYVKTITKLSSKVRRAAHPGVIASAQANYRVSQATHSGANYRSIHRAIGSVRAPQRNVLERVLRGYLLIDFYPQTWLAAAVKIALPDLAHPGKHLMHDRREMILFLNSEAGDRKVHMVSGELIHRIVVAALLPRRAHPKVFA